MTPVLIMLCNVSWTDLLKMCVCVCRLSVGTKQHHYKYWFPITFHPIPLLESSESDDSDRDCDFVANSDSERVKCCIGFQWLATWPQWEFSVVSEWRRVRKNSRHIPFTFSSLPFTFKRRRTRKQTTKQRRGTRITNQKNHQKSPTPQAKHLIFHEGVEISFYIVVSFTLRETTDRSHSSDSSQ